MMRRCMYDLFPLTFYIFQMEFDSFLSRENIYMLKYFQNYEPLIIFDPFCLLMLITPPPIQFLPHLIVIRNRIWPDYTYTTHLYIPIHIQLVRLNILYIIVPGSLLPCLCLLYPIKGTKRENVFFFPFFFPRVKEINEEEEEGLESS